MISSPKNARAIGAARIFIPIFGLLAVLGPTFSRALELKSPDGYVSIALEIKDYAGVKKCPVYRVSYQGRKVLDDSRLGLELEDGSLNAGMHIAEENRSRSDMTWKPICGERDVIRDHYNQVVVVLKTDGPLERTLQLTLRAYDEGVAFRYSIPAGEGPKDFTITAENTNFRFLGDYKTWAIYTAQGNYDGSEVPLSRVKPGVERPLVVRIAGDLYAAITEARCIDYARMTLRPVAGPRNTLEAFLDAEGGKYGKISGTTPFTTPWRVVMVARSPGQLLEHDYLIPNLNDPCALPDTSWIKPGKVIRESTLTTAGGKECVDFCVKRGLQFVEFDCGWYGPENDRKSDAREVNIDPKRHQNPKSLDLHEVIAYAKPKGIGVILYVNHNALERQADELFPLYEKWGVAGVKFGFVNVGSQHWTRLLHEWIRKAAEHKLMVDIHDEFRNTGYQRTWPNLMTVEGIGGNEEFPTPVHNATLPFTRFLTGPADYTFCWYSGKLKATHAHQLAISTIYFSPWQFLFWYDKPSMYDGDPALEYWRTLPTVWDETRVLQGEIGRLASVARRKGDEWYVGTICVNGGPVETSLSFLDSGRTYTATIYSDRRPDGSAQLLREPQGARSSKEVMIETRAVDCTMTLKADMPGNGGQAVRIVPAAHQEANGRFGVFHHPGLLHSKADLDRVREMVAKEIEPWKSGFARLKADPQSQADWRIRGPFAIVSRGTVGSEHIAEMDQDAGAAYQNALMWCATGDEAHAKKSVEILNAWSSVLKQVAGNNRVLGASLGGFKFVNAAELIRYTYPAWHAEDVRHCEQMLKNVYLPEIKDFATYANGNWDTGCIKTMMAIGVFCDDRADFERGVDYFNHGSGNGCLTHYIIDSAGECQETGRDQQHAQLGLGHLADACEIAWNQGLDLYGAADNRLLAGFEYTARYNLGQDVPFVQFRDTTGKYYQKAISEQGRGRLRPIYEMVWNHYENRRGLKAPFTRAAAEKLRPEGDGFSADHPGFGTLMFSRTPTVAHSDSN